MNPEILKMILLNSTVVMLPWLVGGLILIAAVSFSPLGRMFVGYLRDRRRDAEALEAMLAETGALRGVLGEVVERLDATERRLALGPPTPQPRRNPSEDAVRTPV
ncbi:MAG TPA: hypothetical protein VLB00_07715 [Gemmatimonadales bacterium]|nr:hypothetical protein [Gemmatimonadales bacterium]